MNAATIIAVVAAIALIIVVIVWIITSRKAGKAFREELGRKDEEVRTLAEKVSGREADLIRREGEIKTSEALRESERQQHEQALADLKAGHEKALAELKAGQEKALEELRAGQEKALEAARTALALENEKTLKAREEALKKEAAETMKAITGGLDQNIKDMKEAFEAQKKSHTEETSSIKTQFAETVKHLKEQTDAIGGKAETLASALKGQNKMQGIFGETILENILKGEGLREGHDYDSEVWLRDRRGNIIENEETGRKMRPDFALHFPDDTDILIDSKVSLSALADWFAADSDEARADAAKRNLESVRDHVRELTGKEYQKYVIGRKTLDYVIMFIPNYGAWQLAKQEDPEIFSKAFAQNVLITTEETLIPFLRLIRSAWVQKEQIENISVIVESAQNMVDRVALFCEKNAEVERSLDAAVKKFKDNSARLNSSQQSIVGAAWKAISHGIKEPSSHVLPPVGPSLPLEDNPGQQN